MSYLYRIKYKKNGSLRFISHLDLNSLWRRVLLRAEIPVELSEGFNPRMKVSFGPALPLGLEGWQEIMEVSLIEPLTSEVLIDKINRAAPSGFKVIEVKPIFSQKQKISLGKLLKGFSYLVYLRFQNTILKSKKRAIQDRIELFINDLLKQKEIIIAAKTKKGITELDLRPFIQEINIICRSDSRLIICLILNMEQGRSLNPRLIIGKLLTGLEDSVIIEKIVREKFLIDSTA